MGKQQRGVAMSVTDVTSRVESQVASRTGFLAAIQAGRLLTPQALSQSAGYAPVTAAQISDLTAARNTAGCWGTVYVTTSNFNAAAITGCHFEGVVVLGALHGTVAVDGGLQMPSQLRNCTVSNCSILDGTYVVDCRLLSRVVIGDGCVVSGCGFVGASSDSTCCGNGTAIPVGVETGGREVPTFADLAFDDVVVVATQRKEARALDAYREAVKNFQSAAQAEFVYVDAG